MTSDDLDQLAYMRLVHQRGLTYDEWTDPDIEAGVKDTFAFAATRVAVALDALKAESKRTRAALRLVRAWRAITGRRAS